MGGDRVRERPRRLEVVVFLVLLLEGVVQECPNALSSTIVGRRPLSETNWYRFSGIMVIVDTIAEEIMNRTAERSIVLACLRTCIRVVVVRSFSVCFASLLGCFAGWLWW